VTAFIIVYVAPFALIIAAMLWVMLRRTPEQRAKILFTQIVDHMQTSEACRAYYAKNFHFVWGAVQDCDLAYLRAFLKNIRRDYPKA
jgi:hypothetical protein